MAFDDDRVPVGCGCFVAAALPLTAVVIGWVITGGWSDMMQRLMTLVMILVVVGILLLAVEAVS